VTWQTDLLAGAARPLEAFVSVANVTAREMVVRLRMTFSTGRTRTQTERVQAGETWSVKVRALFGSHGSDATTTLTDLTATCDGGATACPVVWSRLVAPTCVVMP